MPGTRRTYSYTLTPKDVDDTALVAAKVYKILGWACDGDKRVTCMGVTGEALGAVTMNFSIVGRDQWWSRQLAQDILNLVTWGLKQPADVDIQSTPAEIHMNRGYVRGNRTKRWRERRTPDPTTTSDQSL